MSVPLEILEAILYFSQQLGIMLGVGAETITLVLFLLAAGDGVIDREEARFLRAVKRVLWGSLALIIVSGAWITLLHIIYGQLAVVLMPAFLFKWLLIIVVVTFAALDHSDMLSREFFKGASGGVWFALFALHIMAPVTSWGILGLLCILWMVAFMTCWFTLTFVFGRREDTQLFTEEQPAPTLAPAAALLPVQAYRPQYEVPAQKQKTPPPMQPAVLRPPRPAQVPRPVMVAAAPAFAEQFPYKSPQAESQPILHPHLTGERARTLPPPPSPREVFASALLSAVEVTPELPAVRVMPQTPEQLESQNRAPVVRFG